MKTKISNLLLALGILVGCSTAFAQTSGEYKMDRTILPIQGPTPVKVSELDARDATKPERFEIKAPKGAPNVVIVIIDDIGFGSAGSFGGTIDTPTFDKLANQGVKYNQFHTTAVCASTRMSLLTGRNHHSANEGSIGETATGFEGNTAVRPLSVAPVTEMLRANGYSTAAFGKYHETPPWEVSASGPYDRWPTSSGFDKFYGFIGGEVNQWAPFLHDGVTPVEIPDDPNYHVTTDLADQAIKWMRAQQAFTPDKPFFTYFAPGAVHAPHHAPQEWVDKYKGKFDDGWDKYREETLARQIELGVVPAGTKLTPRPSEIQEWDALSADEKRLFTRQMEVFAGFASHTDNEVGRLVTALEEMGEMDNTIFMYIWGDNGASAEGGLSGTINEMYVLNGYTDAVEEQLEHIDDLGGKDSYGHFTAGWAHAMNTPFQWMKRVASHYGGSRNPLVVSWPNGIEAQGEVRSQWHHVNDIAPTLMEAAGLPFPTSVNGVEQKPFEGVSMLYSLNDAKAADQHLTQYFEIFANRAIYHKGWVAATKHATPWASTPDATLAEDKWELYHVAEDFSQAYDLAADNPEKLKEMEALFMEEAYKYNVLPLDDRSVERFNAAIAGRPDVMGDRTSLTVYEGMEFIMENVFINVKNRSHTITAEVDIPQGGGEGVILAQGGKFAGWTLFMKNGKVAFEYNFFGKERYSIKSTEALPVGKASIRYEFVYEGGDKPGGSGTGTIFINDQKVAEGKIDKTVPFIFSADETADVGVDHHTPVSNEYGERGNEFTGKIDKITIDLK